MLTFNMPAERLYCAISVLHCMQYSLVCRGYMVQFAQAFVLLADNVCGPVHKEYGFV